MNYLIISYHAWLVLGTIVVFNLHTSSEWAVEGSSISTRPHKGITGLITLPVAVGVWVGEEELLCGHWHFLVGVLSLGTVVSIASNNNCGVDRGSAASWGTGN